MNTAVQTRGIAVRMNVRRSFAIALVFVVAYVFLDWASYIYPLYGLNITPWNPALAVGLLFLLRFGQWAAVPLFFGIVIAEAWVRGLPVSLPATMSLALLLTIGYTAIGLLLRRRFVEGRIFEDRRGLLAWLAVVVVGTFVTSFLFVSAASTIASVPASGWIDALVRFWIGDGVGILVSMPLFWMASEARGRALLHAAVLRWETIGYVALALMAFWVAFGFGVGADFKYFYVLFLPIVWAASRQGFAGAVVSAALMQTGIIVMVRWLGFQAATVLEIQMLMLALALVGFFIGLVVDEHRRTTVELRQTLRLAAAGEMAGALAHELNQPLTAISAYGTACRDLLREGDSGGRLPQVIDRMIAESFRAADVLRRLRDFFRTGAMRLEVVTMRELILRATAPFEERAKREQIVFTIAEIVNASILVDQTQLEVALRNVLSNAFDAVAQTDKSRWVRVATTVESGNRTCITIEDGGTGVSAADASRIFEAFHSKKSRGLGLGLAISRAIVEAHGGNLWAEVAGHGVFKIMLPLEPGTTNVRG